MYFNSQIDNVTVQEGRLPDSASYLRKLESRLVELKGGNKDLKPKDMLAVLQKVREDHMSHLNSSNQESSFLPENAEDNREITNSYLERRLFPERNALVYEELQHLLEADVLAKAATETELETNENRIDR